MPPKRPLAARVSALLSSRYTDSLDAHALRAEADRLKLGEIRLSSASPHVIYLVEGEPSDSLATLEAYASVLFGIPVKVVTLQSLPAWRRERAWSTSTLIANNSGNRA